MKSDQVVIARIRFRDLQYAKDAELVLQIDTGKSEIILFLDEDVDAIGGSYSGECSVGMGAHQAAVLIRQLQRAVVPLPETGIGPNVAGNVSVNWFEPEEPGSKDSGITLLAYSGRVIMGMSAGEKSIDDAYIATFDYKTGKDLATALERGIEALGRSVRKPGLF